MFKKLLFPFSMIYALLLEIRYFLYYTGILKSERVPVATVSVGNLVVGGAGKTPCILYLIENLLRTKKVGLIYRGYKRKSSKKVLEVQLDKEASYYGDEAYLAKFLYPSCRVFVGATRVEAAKELLQKYPDTEVILLDDAFQHLSIQRDFNILLLDASEEPRSYHLLPLGKMREKWRAACRSDFIVLSKANMLHSEGYKFAKENLKNYQKEFDARFDYHLSGFVRLNHWINGDRNKYESLNHYESLTFVSGLAKPSQVLKAIRQKVSANILYKNFPDHHDFNEKDFTNINYPIIISEKDAVKIKDLNLDRSEIFVARSEIIWHDKGEGIASKLSSIIS